MDLNATTASVLNKTELTAVQENSVSREEHHLVDIDNLILGRPLHKPIFDEAGVLLLAEGSIFSDIFKQKLLERNIRQVQAHNNDIHHIQYRVDTGHDVKQLAAETYQKTVNDRLTKVLNDQLTLVNNDGPQFLESVITHGTKGYEKSTRDKQLRQQQECNRLLSGNMQNLLDGKAVSSREIYKVIMLSMQQMQEDSGCFTALGQLLSRDRSLTTHCQRMSNLAMGIGMQLGLNSENIQRIGMTGLLHDWGMLMIPKDIRDPATPPTRVQQLEIEKHCRYSQDIMEKIPQLPTLVPLLSYQVHERIDGTGYPRRKSGKGIHLFARILHIAHEYCTLTTPTRYRAAYAPHIAMTYLLRDEKKMCRDPLVMRGLLRHHSLYPVGSHVMLSDNREAKVIRTNGDQYYKPIVEVTKDAAGLPCSSGEETVDLLNSELKINYALGTPGRNETTSFPGRVDQGHGPESTSHLRATSNQGYFRTTYLFPVSRNSRVSSRSSNLLRG